MELFQITPMFFAMFSTTTLRIFTCCCSGSKSGAYVSAMIFAKNTFDKTSKNPSVTIGYTTRHSSALLSLPGTSGGAPTRSAKKSDTKSHARK